MQSRRIALVLLVGTQWLGSCGGQTQTSSPEPKGDAAIPPGDAAIPPGDAASDQNAEAATLPVPDFHRSAATKCDNTRPTPDPGVPPGDPSASCTAHDQCTAGINGRCGGNSHDGYYCTYDECFEDAECAGFVCECEGGFRSDNNICLSSSNCLVDADCGAGGYCSPTLGSCGNYFGTEGYFCHTPEDDCTNDVDCEVGSYCAYNPVAGKWMCSNAQCAG